MRALSSPSIPGRPLHIAVVVTSDHLGGAERYLTRLYAETARRGAGATLVGRVPSWTDHGLDAVDPDLGPKWSRRTLPAGLLRLPAEARRTRDAVGRLRPDVIQMQYKREQIGFSRGLSRLAPVVWIEHGRWLSGPMGIALAAGYRRASRFADAIICVDERVAGDVRRITRHPHIEVIENAVDTVAQHPPSAADRQAARARLGLAADEPVALWIGRLHRNKLPVRAVEAAAAAGLRLLMVGDGPEREDVAAATRANGARFLGTVPDLTDVFWAADVYLFTSTGEGFPTVLLEAAAHGLPLVMNRGAGIGHLARAAGAWETGDDAGALAEGMRSALAAGASARDRSLAWARAHDTRPWADRHLSLFRSVARRAA